MIAEEEIRSDATETTGAGPAGAPSPRPRRGRLRLPPGFYTTWESLRIALASLRANKLRTALTLIGVVVGVAAVIAVVTIIKGLDQTVASTFSSQGSTVFTISKRPQTYASSVGSEFTASSNCACTRPRRPSQALLPPLSVGMK